jgi:hypothetical protein
MPLTLGLQDASTRYMTARAAVRAGGDHPHRRPAPIGGPARRAALLLVLALALSASLASRAAAAVPEATSPPVMGPVEAIPPPAPELPDNDRGQISKAGHKAGPERKSGKHGRRSKDALELTAGCAPFSHVQAYESWGPAVAYGGPVTVVYEAGRCSTPDGSALDVVVEGTAKVFQGDSATGALVDTGPFLVTGTWRQPKNSEGWPPSWWSCNVPYASYTWEIPGVYTFQVSARDGLWSLDVTSRGAGSQAVSWTHDGCA